MDNCPFAYILQSIGKDLHTMEKNYPNKDARWNSHFHQYLENLSAMFINLNFGLTDAKLKIRFKYWITQLKINLSMQKVFARIIVKTKLIYTENQTTILRMIM